MNAEEAAYQDMCDGCAYEEQQGNADAAEAEFMNRTIPVNAKALEELENYVNWLLSCPTYKLDNSDLDELKNRFYALQVKP